MQEKATRKRKKRMRLPNGLGSVHKIGGDKERRRPWRARVPSHIEIDPDTGNAVQKYITLGYFATEIEGIQALMDYRKDPYTLEAATATFKDVFELWKAENYPRFAEGNKRGYNAAFNNSAPLHDMKMRDIKPAQLKSVMEHIGGGVASQKRLKTFWNQIFKYAEQNDIIDKNYSQSVRLRDKDEGTTRRAIPKEDRDKMWAAVGKVKDADLAVIYCYTGLRPSELLDIKKKDVDLAERIMVGGIKTAAGKERHIPLHKDIIPLIEKRMEAPGAYLVMREDGKKVSYPYFRLYVWKPFIKALGLDYTAHECRHTCATMMREAKIDEDLRKLILGHANGDITDRYTHIPDSMLVEAIDLLPGR